ncbi:MAG: ribosomal-processing cysteine protease Prp [Ruminococcus sp.]|nr:MAG: ribosomal-processing cysteine protease Prp [Ruminococcus sp.]
MRKTAVYRAFSLSGHAGWGESGSDVVCASVSSAAELVCNTVTDFFNDEAEVSVL